MQVILSSFDVPASRGCPVTCCPCIYVVCIYSARQRLSEPSYASMPSIAGSFTSEPCVFNAEDDRVDIETKGAVPEQE